MSGKTYMEFGMRDYEMVYVQRGFSTVKREDLEIKVNDPQVKEKLTLQEIVPILNDYAFFLSEAGDDKKAEPLLHQVTTLDPERAVTYINLGDVCWNLSKREEAHTFYKQYQDLLGDMSKVPQRVIERLR